MFTGQEAMTRPWLHFHPSRTGLGFLIVMCALTILSCRTVEELKPQRGIVTIPLEGGRAVYFKREARGLSFDVLVLSPDPDPCRVANPAVDDVFTSQGPQTVYYKIEGGKLQVYSASRVTRAKASDSGNAIEHHLLEAPDYLAVSETYEQKGLTKLSVPLNVPNGRCR
jgi:hypothetical protein